MEIPVPEFWLRKSRRESFIHLAELLSDVYRYVLSQNASEHELPTPSASEPLHRRTSFSMVNSITRSSEYGSASHGAPIETFQCELLSLP